MIYLIDDKYLRQNDFGWNKEKFAYFSSYINPLYKVEDILQIGEDLYIDNNIILYHESFLDFTNEKDKAQKQREKLTQIAATNPKLSVAFFSGSQGARSLNLNIAYLPVTTLYQNLEILIQQYIKGSAELKYLLFGANPEIEEELNGKLTQSNRNIGIDAIELPGKTIFFHPDEDYIQNAIKEAHNEEIYSDKDSELTELILNSLSEIEYDYIFLPLCFGPTLSDYNGLKLASHIRCTPTRNQLKRIFIYGFVGLEYLMGHEYFNILRTKNIQLVPYSKTDFSRAASTYTDSLKPEELSKEIKKLKLDPPLNYADSHSIANEWAIHQWAKTIGCEETNELKNVFQNVESNLYFKYLRTTNPVSELNKISPDQLKIQYEGTPKILLIDDEAEKGWYEIFAFLLGDLNKIYTDYLCVDFKSLSSNEIVEKSINKIIAENIDVVILDFRLNPSDFENKNPDKITSVNLLKLIKVRNPGVQVIAFSATNKLWNLQALQEAEVDAFFLKDSNVNNRITIENFIQKLSLTISTATWLKPLWNKTVLVIKHLEERRRNHHLDRDFTGAIRTLLELGFDSLVNSKNKYQFDSAFMYYFLILEAISKQIIDEEAPIEIEFMNKYGERKLGYKFQFRSNYKFLKDFEGNSYMQISPGDDLISNNRRIPYNSKFHNLISLSEIRDIDPISIVDLRNKFNHPNLIDNRILAVIEKENVNEIFEVCYKLLNNL